MVNDLQDIELMARSVEACDGYTMLLNTHKSH